MFILQIIDCIKKQIINMNITGNIKGSLPDGASRIAQKLFGAPDDPNLYNKDSYKIASRFSNENFCVVGIAADKGACGHYRLKFPLMHLEKLGVETRISDIGDISDLDMIIFKGATHVILSRCSDRDMFEAIRACCKRYDITLIYDIDDCFHEINVKNPAFGFFDINTEFGNKNLRNFEYFLAESDGVIFSTRELKGYYEEQFPHSHILHNGLDLSLKCRNWSPSSKAKRNEIAASQGCYVDENTVVVGWAGSITHIADLEPMSDAINTILQQNPNSLIGMYCDPEMAMHFCLNSWGLAENRYFLIPPTSFKYYPEKLSYFDIGLAPIKNCAFNRCKSDLRLIEMGAMGVPYVASKVAPYYRFHLQTKGVGGYIAETTEEWVEKTSLLIRKTQERELRGLTLKNYVYNNCDVSNSASSLVYTLKTIRENSFSYTKAPDATILNDRSIGVPKPRKEYKLTDQCPCGSGDQYGTCWRNCSPAWG